MFLRSKSSRLLQTSRADLCRLLLLAHHELMKIRLGNLDILIIVYRVRFFQSYFCRVYHLKLLVLFVVPATYQIFRQVRFPFVRVSSLSYCDNRPVDFLDPPLSCLWSSEMGLSLVLSLEGAFWTFFSIFY